MADLDDFFAKKDKKKSKSVKKFATADEVSKKIDEPKQKNDSKPKQNRPVQEGEEGSKTREQEEEWKEYEEPIKDYTGLKIQVLQGGNGAPDSRRDSSSEDATSDSGRPKGPWNKPTEAENPAPAPVVEERPREPAPPASGGAYVPPTKRIQAAVQPLRRTQTKNAPDIHNDDYFPVLGAAGGPKRGGGGGWSTAAGGAGGRGTTPGGGGGNRALDTSNRFDSLHDDS